jgi:hypothetical protein
MRFFAARSIATHSPSSQYSHQFLQTPISNTRVHCRSLMALIIRQQSLLSHGFRSLAVIHGGRTELISCNGHPFNSFDTPEGNDRAVLPRQNTEEIARAHPVRRCSETGTKVGQLTRAYVFCRKMPTRRICTPRFRVGFPTKLSCFRNKSLFLFFHSSFNYSPALNLLR